MKFNTIRIRPVTRRGKETWSVDVTQLDGDRSPAATRPHPLGFYHYKRSLGAQKAFDELKSCMIGRYLDEIEKMTALVRSLEAIKLPDAPKGKP